MKKLIIPLIFIFFGCNSEENSFYNEFDSLKQIHMGKEITVNKKKFNETSEGITGVYLYTNADRDNVVGEVRFFDSARYELSYVYMPISEYYGNSLDKNKMVQISSSDDNFSHHSGWISIEYIEEFRPLAKYLK